MRQEAVLFACLCSAIAMVSAVPLPANNQELDVLQIPLTNGKELDVLTLGTAEQLADRNKRTIGLLRDLFPDITKQIDDQVNRIVAKLLRVLGPTVLRTAIQGNSGNNRARTSFDADFDDDDDDSSSGSSSSSSGSSGTRVSIELPTFSPDDSDEDNETISAKSTSTTVSPSNGNQSGDGASIDLEALNKQLEETIRVARQASEAEGTDAEKKLTQTNEVQANSRSGSADQQTAESKSPALDELNLDSNEDVADIDDRNKRFLAFGGSSPNGADGSSKGNSGNFLFDIIRLFSGSVQTQTGDEAANSASSVSADGESSDSNDTDASRTTDGYSEGIPGPVTRLVVLANRGLANLIQDLILRIAATSERLVNFKARLITALI